MEKYQDPVQEYLNAIRELPPLAQPERQELVQKTLSGDPEARNRLVWEDLEIVVSIAREYEGRGMAMLDLIQAGNQGLYRGAEMFDWSGDEDFSGFAEEFIRKAIERELSIVCVDRRIPVERIEVINRAMAARRRLEQQLEREPTPREIMEEMNLSQEQIDSVITLLDERSEEAEEPRKQEEKSPARILYEMLQERKSTQSIREFLADNGFELSERECTILALRFGLDGNEKKTMEETAEILGLTRERIRQIENRILRRFRPRLRSKKIRDFYC